MTRKAVSILLVLILLAVSYYFFVYNKLESKQAQATAKLRQEINQFEENKEKLLTLEKMQLKNKKLKEKLRKQNNIDLLAADEINDFVIRLNSYQVVKDIKFNSNPTQNLQLTFDLSGQFKKIYQFLEKIKYSHDLEKVRINKQGAELRIFLLLNFPIEGADQ